MAVVVWVVMTVLLTDTQLKYLLAFQLWYLEELRTKSLFLPFHTMTPSWASVHEESYKYCVNWYLLEFLHNVNFDTQIFLHFWTTMIVDNCALQRCYAACSCNFSPTFRDNLWVPSWPLKLEPIGCPEKLARDCHYTLRNVPEECRSHLLRSGSMKSTLSTICFKKRNIPYVSECIFANFRYWLLPFYATSVVLPSFEDLIPKYN